MEVKSTAESALQLLVDSTWICPLLLPNCITNRYNNDISLCVHLIAFHVKESENSESVRSITNTWPWPWIFLKAQSLKFLFLHTSNTFFNNYKYLIRLNACKIERHFKYLMCITDTKGFHKSIHIFLMTINFSVLNRACYDHQLWSCSLLKVELKFLRK